jgi:GTP cyclohydrolase I
MTNQEKQAVVKQAIRSLLECYDDPNREGLIDTPDRVARAYEEMLEGYSADPARILNRTFDASGYNSMVLVESIDFVSLCEHYMLPFVGTVTIGYIPNLRIVGLSKLPRLVHAFAARLQIQERMTVQIADALCTAIDPVGAGVIISARHMCMTARGVKQAHTFAVTQTLRGIFLSDGVVRSEFLQAART